MPGFKLAFTLVAAAAFAIGKYFLDKKDDDDDPPPRDQYYSSSSYNRGTWDQTQQSYRPPPRSWSPPPPPFDSYETNAQSRQSKTTARSPAIPDNGQYVYRPSVASTQPLRQTQPSAHPQASRPYSSLFDHTRESTVVVPSDFCPDQQVIVEDLGFAKKLREKARRLGREMSEARSQAKRAQNQRHRGTASTYRQLALAYESEMKKLDKRAAKIIFRENNKNRKEGGKIDLHGLYVAEAVQFAKDQVQTAQLKGDDVVRFIVGKGLHAEDGVARIRPALENHFTRQGLGHSLDPNNLGVLIVRLDWIDSV